MESQETEIFQDRQVKSLKHFASCQVIRNLSNINKRNLREKEINSLERNLPDGLFQGLIDAVPEAININSKNKLWYLCQARAKVFKTDKFNTHVKISPCGNYLSYSLEVPPFSQNHIFLNLKTSKRFFETGNLIYWRYEFSPSGKYWACSMNFSDSKKEFYIYETETGIHIATLKHKQDYFGNSCFWSPCEKYLFIINATATLWNIESGDTHSLRGSGIDQSRLCFSSDSKYLFITEGLTKILGYDCNSMKLVFEIPVANENIVIKGLFCDDKSQCLLVCYNKLNQKGSEIIVYDINNFNNQPLVLKNYSSRICDLGFSSISNQLAFNLENDENKIILLNLDGSESEVNQEGLNHFELSPSGKILLTTTKGKKASIWDTNSGNKVFKFNFKRVIKGASFGSDYKIAFAFDNYICTIPTPEGFLRKKIMKCKEGKESALLEEILHLTRKSPQKTENK